MVGENFVYYLHGVTRWIGSGSSTRKVSHEWLVIPFERTIEQTTETMPNANPKTITAANNQKSYKLTRAATLLDGSGFWEMVRRSPTSGWDLVWPFARMYSNRLKLSEPAASLRKLMLSSMTSNSCYWSYQRFDIQTRRKGQFRFLLALSPRLYAFLNNGIFDRRLNCNKSYLYVYSFCRSSSWLG